MKYLSESMSPEEAKKAYRKLAKTMHPDVGGDTEEFKILASEYTAIIRNTAFEETSIESAMKASAKMVDTIVASLQELYPRTPVVLFFSVNSIEVDFKANTPISRIVEIESVINSFKYPFSVSCSFHREGRKAPLTLVSRDLYTYINTTPQACVDVDLTGKEIYDGRRYKIYENPRYSTCTDTKTGRVYVMRRTPKFTLKELLGL